MKKAEPSEKPRKPIRWKHTAYGYVGRQRDREYDRDPVAASIRRAAGS